MADAAAAKRVQQREVLALLVAVSALVLPLSGAVAYLELSDTDVYSSWVLPFLGASNTADVMGPVLLAGALGLGVIAARGRGAAGQVARAVAAVVVLAAAVQGAAFLVTAFDLVRSRAYSVPSGAAWQAAKWSLFARLAAEAAVCATAAVLGLRWLAPDDRREAR